MAIDINGQIVNTNAPDANFPLGSAKDVTSQGAGDGTPFNELWLNDIFGFFQSILDLDGAAPNGTPDNVNNTQYLDSLTSYFSKLAEDRTMSGPKLILNGSPAAVPQLAITDFNESAIVLAGSDDTTALSMIKTEFLGDETSYYAMGCYIDGGGIWRHSQSTKCAGYLSFNDDGFLHLAISDQNVGGVGDPVSWVNVLNMNRFQPNRINLNDKPITQPAGAILLYPIGFGGGGSFGWFKCDGAAVSRAVYADLFAAIGTTYGVGDGATTFNVPDYRGYFPRFWDDGAGVDPDAAGRTAPLPGGVLIGDNAGTVQPFEVQSHDHTAANSATTVGAGSFADGSPDGGSALTTDLAGGNETRPINVYLAPYIKF